MQKEWNLRGLSGKVASIIKYTGLINNKMLADQIVAEYFQSFTDLMSIEKQTKIEKNLRRRIYDAVNVLASMAVIRKDNNELCWIGLPTPSLTECKKLEVKKMESLNRIQEKQKEIRELICQLVSSKSLIERNREQELTFGSPPEETIVRAPYMILYGPPDIVVDATYKNKSEIEFNFSQPFEACDNSEIQNHLGFSYGIDRDQILPEAVCYLKSCLPPSLQHYIDEYADIQEKRNMFEGQDYVGEQGEENEEELREERCTVRGGEECVPVEEIPYEEMDLDFDLSIPENRNKVKNEEIYYEI